jgi:hypothetical protein
MNVQPLHHIGWYGIETLEPFLNTPTNLARVAEWEAKYGWLIDAWLEMDVFNWPYFGTSGIPPWRLSTWS